MAEAIEARVATRAGTALVMVLVGCGKPAPAVGDDETAMGTETGPGTESATEDGGEGSTATGETGDDVDMGTGGPTEPCWEVAWQHTGMLGSQHTDVELLPNGGVVASAWSWVEGEGTAPSEAAIVVRSSTGEGVWSDGIPVSSQAHGVAVDIDGNSYLVWDTGSEGPWEAHGGLRRYDLDGNLDWEVITDERLFDVAIEGEVLVAVGTREVSPEVSDAWVSRRDVDTGEEVWVQTVASTGGRASAREVAVSDDGTIMAGGRQLDMGEAEAGDGWLGAWAADGTSLWEGVVDIGDPEARRNAVGGIAADEDGTFVVVGDTADGARTELWIRRYTMQGEVQWTRQSGDSAYDEHGRAVAIGPDGDLAVGGNAQSEELDYGNALVQRRSHDGTLLWENHYGGDQQIADNERVEGITWMDADRLVVAGVWRPEVGGNFAWVACWPAEGLEE